MDNDIKGILGYVTEPSRNVTLTTTTTSSQVAEQRIRLQPRKLIVIRNLADPTTNPTHVISFALGNTPAVSNQGIVLKPSESFTDVNSEGYECWQGSIQAISAAGSPQIAIFER